MFLDILLAQQRAFAPFSMPQQCLGLRSMYSHKHTLSFGIFTHSTPNNHSRLLGLILSFLSILFAERWRQRWSRHERSTSMAKRVYRKRRCCFHSRWRHSNKSSGSNSKLCKYKIKWNRMKMKWNEQKRERTTRDESAGATTDSLSRNCTAYGTQFFLILVIFFIFIMCFALICARMCAWACFGIEKAFGHNHRKRFNNRLASTGNYLCVYPYGHCTNCKQNYEWHSNV